MLNNIIINDNNNNNIDINQKDYYYHDISLKMRNRLSKTVFFRL